MNYKEAFFKLLDERAESIAGARDEVREGEVKELFELLGQLEDQEGAKDWVAETIDDLNVENEPFLREGIRFIRPQVFKQEAPEKPETPKEKEEIEPGGDEGSS